MTTSSPTLLHVTVQLATICALMAGCDTESSQPGNDAASDGKADDVDPGSSDGLCSVEPTSWTADRWDANTATQAAARSALATLSGGLMRDAENDNAETDLDAMRRAFEDGEPSLAAITHPAFVPVMEDAFAEFNAVGAAGPRDLMTIGSEFVWVGGEAGGYWGDSNRGINEGGIELRQVVDKGLFGGGAFYYHATQLTTGPVDEATIDQIAYIWGANASMDPEDSDNALDDSARYTHRQGYFADAAEALTAAKAYSSDPACATERDEALVDFFNLWEESVMSRATFYVNQGTVQMTLATTQDEFAEALHEVSEGIGLIAGFYQLPDPEVGPLHGRSRTISDEDLLDVLDHLRVDISDLGASTHGEFTENLADYELAQESVEGVFMDVYGVDELGVSTWRNPTPG